MIDLIEGMAVSIAKQQEEWLRGLGIETEDDARAIAEHWMLEYSPGQIEDAGGGRVKLMQTVRLVPRNAPSESE